MKPFSIRVRQLPPSLSVSVHRCHTGPVTVGTLWLGSAEGAVIVEGRDFWSDSTDLINPISLGLGANLDVSSALTNESRTVLLSRFDPALKDLFLEAYLCFTKSIFHKLQIVVLIRWHRGPASEPSFSCQRTHVHWPSESKPTLRFVPSYWKQNLYVPWKH